LFNLGSFEACLQAIQAGGPLYDLATQSDHASLYGGHDAQVCAHGIGGMALCLSGRMLPAAERIEQGIESARLRDDPGSLAHALDFATLFYRMCEDTDKTIQNANALTDCATEHGFADYELRARAFRGWAMARAGDVETGLPEM
jgi:hypothetical protein